MELFHGRPADSSGRLAKEIRVYDLLDNLGMDYYRTDHEAADNMEACNDIDAVLGTVICKNLFLCTANKKKFYLLMMHVSGLHRCAYVNLYSTRKQVSI